jgi:hypothetical protein
MVVVPEGVITLRQLYMLVEVHYTVVVEVDVGVVKVQGC